MNTTAITREIATVLHKDINDALGAIGERHGLTIKTGALTWRAAEASCRITARTRSADGQARDTEAEAFTLFAPSLGLSPADLGKTVMIAAQQFVIVGYKPKARKNCVVIKEVASGKKYTTTVAAIKHQLT